MNVVDFAYQILEMHDRIQHLEIENAKLREYRIMYDELLERNINHQEHMGTGLLNVVMTPGVLDAMSASKQE